LGEFIQGLGTQWLWRIGLTVFGFATYMLAARISLLEYTSADWQQQRATLPVARCDSHGFLFCGGNFDVHSWCAESGGDDPDSDFRRGIDLRRLIRTVMEHQLTQRGTLIPYGPPAEPMPIQRSWPLIAASCAIAVAFVAVLGPSVRFAH